MTGNPFDLFMAPRSVALIGVSRKTGEGSFNLIENLRDYGFQGRIYPVNPYAREIAGLRTFAEVKEIGEPVDLAVISTPRQEVARTAVACADVGIRGAVVVPQGFADADAAGKEMQHELTRIARERGIRILGPNTLGVCNPFVGFTSSFMPLKAEKVPVGVICQSGIFFVGAAVFTGLMGKGIDVGNGCDLDFADALEYFGHDPDTRVIFAHIEGLDRGRRFFEVAREVTPEKPVIVLKTARTSTGARAALSHSGSLVGEYAVFEAALRQAGVTVARDSEEVLDFTRAFLRLPLMPGERVAVVTLTGAGGIILIDAFHEAGLKPAQVSPATVNWLKALSPAWMPIQNPLDIWPALMKHGMEHVYQGVLSRVLQDEAVDGVICISIAPRLPEDAYLDVTPVIGRTAAAFPDKPVVTWLYGPSQAPISRTLEGQSPVLSLPTLPRAARTLAALRQRALFLERRGKGGREFEMRNAKFEKEGQRA